MLAAALICFGFALIPCVSYIRRAGSLRVPAVSARRPPFSVLIAGGGEGEIAGTVRSVLACGYPGLEIVLPDGGTGMDGAVVAELAAASPGVTWTVAAAGEQGMRRRLEAAARHDWLLFLDAGVRLHRDALVRLAGETGPEAPDLVRGLLRQGNPGVAARMMAPLIPFVLLGLPPGIPGVSRARMAEGPLLWCRRGAYGAAMDPATEPGRAGLLDATPLAVCRSADPAAWHSLLDPADRGLRGALRLTRVTVLLAGGQVAPFVLRALYPVDSPVAAWAAAAIIGAWTPGAMAAVRFRQSWLGVLLHPVAVLLLLLTAWRRWWQQPSARRE